MNLLIFQIITLYVLMETTVIAKIVRLSATTKSPIVRLSATTKSPDVNQDKLVERGDHINYVDIDHQKVLVVPGGYNYTSKDTVITVGRKPLRLKEIRRLPLRPPLLNNEKEKLKNKSVASPQRIRFMGEIPDNKTTYDWPWPLIKKLNANKRLLPGTSFGETSRYYLPSKSLYNNDTSIQVQEDDHFDYYIKTEQ